jgi:hypothetical protein
MRTKKSILKLNFVNIENNFSFSFNFFLFMTLHITTQMQKKIISFRKSFNAVQKEENIKTFISYHPHELL